MDDIETKLRACVARLMPAVGPELDLDAHLTEEIGLTSMKLVMLVTALCRELGVGLSSLTEADIAGMTTGRGVVERLDRVRRAEAA
ncbi:acyl carrier protein [Salinarimonas sp.]|uniref:acyl carrier protein n=1 Tax=Salinarimonas sp. TaxID=2766526 RepID=UPI0032D9298E